jgi:hypothetical protein
MAKGVAAGLVKPLRFDVNKANVALRAVNVKEYTLQPIICERRRGASNTRTPDESSSDLIHNWQNVQS